MPVYTETFRLHLMSKYYPSSRKNKRQTTPLVSFIVVTFNSEKYIRSCLKALLQTAYPSFECIIVDNNSKDNTVRIVKAFFPAVRLIQNNENLGYAAANNIGSQYSKGKYLAIINPDTIVYPGWLEPLLTAIKEPGVAVCQPKIMLAKKSNLINLTGKTTHFLGFEWPTDHRKKDRSMEQKTITSFSGSTFLIKKELFQQIGGFDKLFFMYYEDGDLSWQLRSRGYKILLVPQSIVSHDYKYQPDENYQKVRRKFYLLERNRIVMMLKNYSLKTLILLLPPLIVMESGMTLYFFLKGWQFDKGKAYLWIIKNLAHILSARKNIQRARTIPDREIVKDFQGQVDFVEFHNPILKYLVNPLLGSYWSIIRKLI